MKKCKRLGCNNKTKRKYCSHACANFVITQSLCRNQKISRALVGKVVSPSTRKKLRAGRLGKKHSKRSRVLISQAQLGKALSETCKQKIRLNAMHNSNFGMKGKHHTKANRQKMRRSARLRWKNRPMNVFHMVSKMEQAWGHRIKEIFGVELVGSFWLDGKCFDFKHPDKNILFEIDGVYWHTHPRAMKNDQYKNMLAEKHGYKLYRFVMSSEKDVDANILHNFVMLLALLTADTKTLTTAVQRRVVVLQEQGLISSQCEVS